MAPNQIKLLFFVSPVFGNALRGVSVVDGVVGSGPEVSGKTGFSGVFRLTTFKTPVSPAV